MFSQLQKISALLNRGDVTRLLLLALMLLVNAALEVAGVGLILPFIQLTNSPGLIHETRGIAQLYYGLGFSSETAFIAALGAGFFILVVIKNGCYLASTAYQTHLLAGKAAQTAQQLFRSYMYSPWVRITQRNSADLISTAENASAWVFQTVIPAYVTLLAEGLVVAGIIAVMIAAEPQITLIAASVLGLLFAALYLVIRRRASNLGQCAQEITAARLKALQQGLGSIKETRVLGREEYFLAQFQQHAGRSIGIASRLVILQTSPRLLVEVLVMGGIVLVVLMILADSRPTAEITAVLGLFAVGAFRMMPSLNRLLMALHNIRYGDSAVDLVDADFRICDEQINSSCGPLPRLSRLITVDHVTFSYPESEAILRDISFSVPRGKSIGFVGASGAGKSTLIDLILGVLQPQFGAVRVDGVDIAQDMRSWQDQIGYVPQTITLIDDTIRRNVAFGIDEEKIDETAVARSLGMAQLERFVASLPQGMDTIVGERGIRLSGGQRQRIGIARALYHDPQILVMDEATSALDGETEQEITRAIEGLRGDKTLLIIAHRLSTVKHCDTLIIMQGGQIIDSGGFGELAERCPEFQRMVAVAEVMAGQASETNALL